MIKVALILLVGLVALTQAEHHGTHCDELTILKVKAQWARAYSHGHSREHFAEAVWRTAFNIAPELKERLHKKGADDTSSGKFRAFALFTLAGIDMSVTFLDNPEALKAEFEHVGKLQAARGVPDEFIDAYIKALGHVVPAQLGRCWDKEAWKACFKVIGDGFKGHN